jgi:hypothetical protein
MEKTAQRQTVLVERRPSEPPSAAALGRHASLILWAAGGVLLLGSLIDVAVLWGLQRQGTPQWEFVAVQNTLEALPRFALACALLALAVYVRRTGSGRVFRLLGVVLLLFAVAAAALGAILVTDYFIVARMAAGQLAAARTMLKIATLKSLALSGLYTLLLGVFGLLAVRRLRS